MPDTDANPPDIDWDDLGRRTFGDQDLSRELLVLFEAHCRRVRPALAPALAPTVRARAVHALRGAALAVGAARVARLAAAAEESGGELRDEDLAELGRALDDVVNVIRSGPTGAT